MKPELQEKLVKDFPQIFRDWRGDPTKTCMAWGIAVGNGWYNLIRKLCEDAMAANPGEDFKAEQVKEKFGGLRFYVSGSNSKINELVNIAEQDSYTICEDCGSIEEVSVESRKPGGWVVTLCKQCRTK